MVEPFHQSGGCGCTARFSYGVWTRGGARVLFLTHPGVTEVPAGAHISLDRGVRWGSYMTIHDLAPDSIAEGVEDGWTSGVALVFAGSWLLLVGCYWSIETRRRARELGYEC